MSSEKRSIDRGKVGNVSRIPVTSGVRQIQCYSGSSVAGFGEPEVRELPGISTMIDTLAAAPEQITEKWFNTHTPISLQKLRGKVVVIEAFQMLCPVCVLYGIPQAVRISQTFSSNDVTVLGLHTVFKHHEAQGSLAALKAFIHEYKIAFPIAIDAGSAEQGEPQTMRNYALRGTPSLILIDREGRDREQLFCRKPDLALGATIKDLVLDRTPSANDLPWCCIKFRVQKLIELYKRRCTEF